jgi:hypothetical protein
MEAAELSVTGNIQILKRNDSTSLESRQRHELFVTETRRGPRHLPCEELRKPIPKAPSPFPIRGGQGANPTKYPNDHPVTSQRK